MTVVHVGPVQPVGPSRQVHKDEADEREIGLGKAIEGKDIEVPDAIWAHPKLTQGAKVLWCLLWVLRLDFPELAFAEIRKLLSISHTSLISHLKELADRDLLHWTKPTRHWIRYKVIRPSAAPSLTIPSDLLLDHDVWTPAKWLWGIIQRLDTPFNYQQLRDLTGHCRQSVHTYLSQLQAGGWLSNEKAVRVNRHIQYASRALNPHAERRKAELDAAEQELSEADGREHYSRGQCLLKQAVKLLLPNITIVENAQPPDLINPQTSGQMEYDIWLKELGIAIELHGLQHAGPTEKYPGITEFRNRRARDLMKTGITWEQGRILITIWTHELSLDRLRELLSPWVQVRRDFRGDWHMQGWLEMVTKWYREKVPRPPQKSPTRSSAST